MVKGYKGFNQGLICNPNGKKFQFEEGKTYEEDKAIPCQTGFHYCKNPLDVLDFYPLIANDGTMNEFAEIEASEDITDDKIKFVSKKITIGAKLNIKGLINASVEFIKKETKISENVQASSGDRSQLASSGHRSKLASSGNYSQLALNGKNSVGANIGIGGQISGVLGSWITLAEYDENYICKYVKSVKIDGVKLKENAMYELKNGKFVKV